MAIDMRRGEQNGVQHREKILATLAFIKRWPYWEEVFLNCVKESSMTYEAFAQAVQTGDSSRCAFDQALQASQISREAFDRYLPEYQRYMALCAHYSDIGMMSTGVDAVWHAHMLITDRYQEFCRECIGDVVHHLPCSLYPKYGVAPRSTLSSSCISSCLPSTCSGNGGGGGCKKSGNQRDIDPEATQRNILSAGASFVQAYTEAYEMVPSPEIWDQLA